jgi:hypothetical protein
MSDKMNEFLDKVDRLCWEYGYEIHPNNNKVNGEYDTIIVTDGTEIVKLVYIDGDGRGE